MSKVRINDLARELEVKSKAILDSLPVVGVTEKKTHSSSLEEHEAEKVRGYFRAAAEAQPATTKSARPSRGEEEIKTKIDLSNISRPGDVLKAITQQKEAVAPSPVKPTAPVPGPPAAIPTPPAAAKPGVVAPPKPPAVPVTPQPISPPRSVTPVAKTVLPATPAPPAQVPPPHPPPPPRRWVPPPAITASVTSVASAPAAPVAGSRPVASAVPPPR